jgi:hypothetical protein
LEVRTQVLDRTSTTFPHKTNSKADEAGFKAEVEEEGMTDQGIPDHSLQTNQNRGTRFQDVSRGF